MALLEPGLGMVPRAHLLHDALPVGRTPLQPGEPQGPIRSPARTGVALPHRQVGMPYVIGTAVNGSKLATGGRAPTRRRVASRAPTTRSITGRSRQPQRPGAAIQGEPYRQPGPWDQGRHQLEPRAGDGRHGYESPRAEAHSDVWSRGRPGAAGISQPSHPERRLRAGEKT